MTEVLPSLELLEVLKRIYRAAREGDAEVMSNLFSSHSAFLFLGTDQAEVWRDHRSAALLLRKQWEEMGHAYPLFVGKAKAFVAGDVGWIEDWPVVAPPFPADVPFRCTGVFHLERGTWKLIQWHTSVAVGNAEVLGVELTSSIDRIADAISAERPSLGSAPASVLRTIMFTDIESSTTLNARLGDERWMTILRAHNEVIRGQVKLWNGFEVKSIGDGFMLAFASPPDALGCALAIQDAVRGLELPDLPPIKVRIGLHAGELVHENNDFYGATVNYASRVASAAAGGEVLASARVLALAEGTADVRFDSQREVALKGFEGVHALYAASRC